jgi:hypothetical protein
MYIHTTMQKNIIMGLLTLVAIFLILATTNTNAETGTDISTGSKDRFKAWAKGLRDFRMEEEIPQRCERVDWTNGNNERVSKRNSKRASWIKEVQTQ